jgi:acyl carrier protein
MMSVTMLEQIKVTLRESVQGLSEADAPLADDTELLISGLLDSMAVTQVVAKMEACLNREVPPLDITIENFETLQSMFNYVAARIASS